MCWPSKDLFRTAFVVCVSASSRGRVCSFHVSWISLIFSLNSVRICFLPTMQKQARKTVQQRFYCTSPLNRAALGTPASGSARRLLGLDTRAKTRLAGGYGKSGTSIVNLDPSGKDKTNVILSAPHRRHLCKLNMDLHKSQQPYQGGDFASTVDRGGWLGKETHSGCKGIWHWFNTTTRTLCRIRNTVVRVSWGRDVYLCSLWSSRNRFKIINGNAITIPECQHRCTEVVNKIARVPLPTFRGNCSSFWIWQLITFSIGGLFCVWLQFFYTWSSMPVKQPCVRFQNWVHPA